MGDGQRTDDEVLRAGFAALRQALGVQDAIRFVRLYTGATGNYTAERELIIGDRTLEDLIRELGPARKQDETPTAA
jgi:hypothetical protein